MRAGAGTGAEMAWASDKGKVGEGARAAVKVQTEATPEEVEKGNHQRQGKATIAGVSAKATAAGTGGLPSMVRGATLPAHRQLSLAAWKSQTLTTSKMTGKSNSVVPLGLARSSNGTLSDTSDDTHALDGTMHSRSDLTATHGLPSKPADALGMPTRSTGAVPVPCATIGGASVGGEDEFVDGGVAARTPTYNSKAFSKQEVQGSPGGTVIAARGLKRAVALVGDAGGKKPCSVDAGAAWDGQRGVLQRGVPDGMAADSGAIAATHVRAAVAAMLPSHAHDRAYTRKGGGGGTGQEMGSLSPHVVACGTSATQTKQSTGQAAAVWLPVTHELHGTEEVFLGAAVGECKRHQPSRRRAAPGGSHTAFGWNCNA